MLLEPEALATVMEDLPRRCAGGGRDRDDGDHDDD
jgi:hypothetical protein